jgi:ribonucleotide reductase beta subunit family protein with ferritin-like domain
MTIRVYHDRSDKVVEHFTQYTERFSKVQLQHLWFPDEIKVEKDKHQLMTEMSEASRHGIMTTLKLFTQYEIFAGSEYWGGRFRKIMRGPEFERMASVFAAFELGIHKPFYQQINQVFNLDTDEFYEAYVDDPVLKSRMEFLDSMVNHPNDLVSLGVFSMIEGAILYSAFGFLKSFQSNGKNEIKHTVSGVDFSLLDENLHSVAGATCFAHMIKEMREDGVLQDWEVQSIYSILLNAARKILEHEVAIIKKIFEKGSIPGVTELQLINFVKSRLNECLVNLGIGVQEEFKVDYNPIREWFYKSITSYKMHDFFNTSGSQYVRNWNAEDFVWEKDE